MQGKLQYVKGDVTNPQGKGTILIPHICNNVGGYGAGVAKAIARKWPEAAQCYREHIKDFFNNKLPILGTVNRVHIYNDDNEIYIMNMIAQSGYISNENPRPIKYTALIKCMDLVMLDVKSDERLDNASIHCPKFGSKLSGGDFNFVLALINEIWIDNGIDVTIYEF